MVVSNISVRFIHSQPLKHSKGYLKFVEKLFCSKKLHFMKYYFWELGNNKWSILTFFARSYKGDD